MSRPDASARGGGELEGGSEAGGGERAGGGDEDEQHHDAGHGEGDAPSGRSRAQLLGASERSPALELLKESLALSRDLGDRPGILECLETLAAVAGRDGNPHEGALLIGAASAARVAAGATRQPDEDAWVHEVEAELRDGLGADSFTAAVRDGERLELREAVDRALAI